MWCKGSLTTKGSTLQQSPDWPPHPIASECHHGSWPWAGNSQTVFAEYLLVSCYSILSSVQKLSKAKNKKDSRHERFLWVHQVTQCDCLNHVQQDAFAVKSLQPNEIVAQNQHGKVAQYHQLFTFIVPVINPEKRGMSFSLKHQGPTTQPALHHVTVAPAMWSYYIGITLWREASRLTPS